MSQELPPVAKEASFLISLATEQFIQRLAKASQVVAKRENRVTIQYKDIGADNQSMCFHLRYSWTSLNSIRSATSRRILVLGRYEFDLLERLGSSCNVELFDVEILPWADVSSAPKRRNLKADVEKETDQTTLDDKLKKKTEENSVALVRGSPEDLETPRDRDAEDEGGTAASA